jgi:hypothetical protein
MKPPNREVYPGLSDCSWCNIPNYVNQITMANGHKIYQMVVKYTNIFHCKSLQNLPKLWYGYARAYGYLRMRSDCTNKLWVPKLHPQNAAPEQGCQMVSFQTKNTNLGKFRRGLRLENVDIFYVHLEHFTDTGDVLWPFGTFCVHLVHFFRFWYNVPRKIWQPCSRARK